MALKCQKVAKKVAKKTLKVELPSIEMNLTLIASWIDMKL